MKYFLLIIKHKWFVLLAGIKIGCPLSRLLLHDMSKFSPRELPHYQRQFFGRADDPEGFIRCWLHHQNHNDHHWEYWIPRTGHNRCTPPYPDNRPIKMPINAALEMVADWLGASRTYEGKWPNKPWPWLEKNYSSIIKRLAPETKEFIDAVLEKSGYASVDAEPQPEAGKEGQG